MGRVRLAALAAALLAVTFSVAATAATARHRLDLADVARLASKHPAARDLLERGEALAVDGKLDLALAAFHQAAVQAPESALVARRECQTLALLDRRKEAIESCLRALRDEGSAMDMRAMVGALVAGREAPTTGELAQAMRLARRASDSMPSQPWGYAAMCDIAVRIGDVEMQEGCLRELQRFAPGHYETVRALAAAGPRGMTGSLWATWAAIAALGLGTLAHLVWVALRQRSRHSGLVAAASGLLVWSAVMAPPATAHAQEKAAPPHAGESVPSTAGKMLSDWPVDDNDPEKSVPTVERRERNPLQFGYWLMDLTWKAAQATKHGDHQAAIRYYKALVKAVSDRSVSFTRLCEAYEAADDWQNALQACSTALTREGVTVQDYVHYFKLALAKKGSLSAQEVDVLSKVLDHLGGDPAGREIVDDLECQLAVRLEDLDRLQRCTRALAAKAPDDPRTLSFQWALAVRRGDDQQAEAIVDHARTTSMPPEGIDQMVQAMDAVRADRRHSVYAWSFGGLAAVLAGGGLIVLMARRKPSTAEVTT